MYLDTAALSNYSKVFVSDNSTGRSDRTQLKKTVTLFFEPNHVNLRTCTENIVPCTCDLFLNNMISPISTLFIETNEA